MEKLNAIHGKIKKTSLVFPANREKERARLQRERGRKKERARLQRERGHAYREREGRKRGHAYREREGRLT
jgi:hypothetical protein